MGVVKSGWLYHYTNGKFKKKWKLRFVILYEDDYLSIYKRPQDGTLSEPLERINMRKQCKQILSGHLCYKWESMQLPKGVLAMEALFTVSVKSFQIINDYTFAALSVSERKEWESMLLGTQSKATPSDVFGEKFLAAKS